MNPKIELVYFKLRGRAELLRLILAYGNLDYTEKNYGFDEWSSIKPTTLFGSLPILTYDGEEIGQSLTIARFLAKKVGIAGKNDLEMAQADMIADYCEDILAKSVPFHFAPDQETKNKLVLEWIDTTVPTFLQNVEKILKKRGGNHFAGSNFTYADLFVTFLMDQVMDKDDYGYKGVPNVDKRFELLDKYPLVKELRNRVRDIPSIKKRLETRPKMDF